MKSPIECALYFGNIADLYYSFRGLKKLNQLDLLDILFPGILVFERENKASIYDLFDELPDVDW